MIALWTQEDEATLRRLWNDDDTDLDLANALRALAAKIEARKAALK